MRQEKQGNQVISSHGNKPPLYTVPLSMNITSVRRLITAIDKRFIYVVISTLTSGNIVADEEEGLLLNSHYFTVHSANPIIQCS